MRVTGTEVLALTPDEAWKRISDVETLGAALPSVQAVNVETADRFTAAFRPTTGLGSTPVRMTFTVTDRQAPGRLQVEGRGGATDSAVHVRCDLALAANGSGTEVSWAVDAQVLGVLRSLTQRVLPALVTDQVTDVLRAVRDGNGGAGAEPGADVGTGGIVPVEPGSAPPAAAPAAGAPQAEPPAADDGPLDPEHAERIAGAGANADEIADPERFKKGPGW
jgi:carbon monoxide dehydrogenase subunit G